MAVHDIYKNYIYMDEDQPNLKFEDFRVIFELNYVNKIMDNLILIRSVWVTLLT